MRTTVSSRGQAAVPAEVRRRFYLSGRARLEWLIDGDLITVLPVPSDPGRALRGSLKGLYSGKRLLKDRARERRRERRDGRALHGLDRRLDGVLPLPALPHRQADGSPSCRPRILATKPPVDSPATSFLIRSRVSSADPFFAAAFIVPSYAAQTSAPVIS